MTSPSFVTPATAPRTLEGLADLTRSARLRIAMQISMLPSPDLEGAFVSMSDADQAKHLLDGLLHFDRNSGQPVQSVPMQSNPQPQQVDMTNPGQPQMQFPQQPQGQPGFAPQMPQVVPPPQQMAPPPGIPQSPPQGMAPPAFGQPSPMLPPFPGAGGAPGGFGAPMMGAPQQMAQQPMMAPQQPAQGGFGQPMMGAPGGAAFGAPGPQPGFGQAPQGFGGPPPGQGMFGGPPPQGNPGFAPPPGMQLAAPPGFAPTPPAQQTAPVAQQAVQTVAQGTQTGGQVSVPPQVIQELLQALKTATETSNTMLQNIHGQQQEHQKALQGLVSENQALARRVDFLLRVTVMMVSQYPNFTLEGLLAAVQQLDTSAVERAIAAQAQAGVQQGKA